MIEIFEINKRYGDSEVNVLDNCSAAFNIGEKVAIFGENGSGKTTLIKILGLLERNFSGSYKVDGKDVSQMPGKETARLRNETFGFMFQDYKLLENESVYNNVVIPLIYSNKYCRSDRRKRVFEAAEILGIEKLLTKKTATLSRGEKQLTALARALVNKPSVLILDEPFTALSDSNRQRALEYINNIADSTKLLIMVTHNKSIYDNPDYKSFEMKGGKLFEYSIKAF